MSDLNFLANVAQILGTLTIVGGGAFAIVQILKARVHAHLVSSLGRGVTLGVLDLIIGATAIRHGFTVLTTNAQDFRRMAGCVVVAVE